MKVALRNISLLIQIFFLKLLVGDDDGTDIR